VGFRTSAWFWNTHHLNNLADQNNLGAFRQITRRINGGQNGQWILSKYPIQHVQETQFEGFMSNRINIFATINNIRVGFGHFAFNVLADYGPFGPYQYGVTQIDHAKDMVAQNADVLIGDFNSGLDYQPEGYDYLLANGYLDLIQTQPVETWCPPSHVSAFLPCVNAGEYSAAIDHVMIKDSCSLWGSHARTWNDQPLMSDHVGVVATIRKFWWLNKEMEAKMCH